MFFTYATVARPAAGPAAPVARQRLARYLRLTHRPAASLAWDGNPHLISRLIELLVRYRRIGAARVALRNVPRQLWWVLRRHQLDMLFIVDPDPEPTRAC
ncbi:MAG: hypothetical protein ACOC1F_11345 [Myxococcota bacterium]